MMTTQQLYRCEDILKTVSKISGISIEDIKSNKKPRMFADIRQIYAYLCSQESINAVIAMQTINRDRTSFYPSVQVAKDKIEYEPEMLRLYKQSCHELGIEP